MLKTHGCTKFAHSFYSFNGQISENFVQPYFFSSTKKEWPLVSPLGIILNESNYGVNHFMVLFILLRSHHSLEQNKMTHHGCIFGISIILVFRDNGSVISLFGK